MAGFQELIDDIQAAPAGPGIGAVFDFDGTVICGYSAAAFVREQLWRGDLSALDLLELVQAMTNFRRGSLGFSAMMTISTRFLGGIDEDSYIELGETLYQTQIARLIYPESRALIAAHLARGHTVAIISSATIYQVAPAARDLGIEHVMCTHLEVRDGRFTGAVIQPTCFGQGKVDAAEQLAREHEVDLDASFFYSDSEDDLQLLERVCYPRVLNPSRLLRGIARDRNWPVARFLSRGRPSMSQYLRSAAATISLVPSLLAGLPIYALTRSRRQSINFSLSLFADTASALIGLDLNVKGQEHLWARRPAVFIFNHQSKADVVIIASLIRRDMAGVGKKEIRNIPVIGRFLELGGVVMIDRANATSAIEAMAPLVRAMREEGKSVALAPEGTRSVSPRLGPFKKGAFHLAMQAGVPIIPIVIRNAGDVVPKGDFVFRPATVDVEVLPPIETSEWRVRDLNKHVQEVRQLFLDCLGQRDPLPTSAMPGQARSGAKPASRATRGPAAASAAPTQNTPGGAAAKGSRRGAATPPQAARLDAGPEAVAASGPKRRSRSRPRGAPGT